MYIIFIPKSTEVYSNSPRTDFKSYYAAQKALKQKKSRLFQKKK
ncbi:hypothetical protein [Clostridium botulinum]